MPNIAQMLKAEISRIARKESRSEVEALKRSATASRGEIAALKRQVRELERVVKALMKAHKRTLTQTVHAVQPSVDGAATGLRFSAKGLANNRQRLGLSAADFALLVGTTGQSIYAWESGKAHPSAKYLAAIAALRGLGKREIAARLLELRSA
ncbi:MAG: helix-turn-helix transcriptional regulator [Paucibacter sp.]|nr:helix-turn-helix transcriptional regulator [Roseateles sp.]